MSEVKIKFNPPKKPRLRVLRLYRLFRNNLNRKFTLSELALNIGCSKSRILDMLGTIKTQIDDEYGLELQGERTEGGQNQYFIKTTRDTVNVTLDEQGIQNLCFLSDAAKYLVPECVTDNALDTINKVRKLTEGDKTIPVNSLIEMKGRGRVDYSGHQAIFKKLFDAIKNYNICDVKYWKKSFKWGGSEIQFSIVPIRLMLYRETIYLTCIKIIDNKPSEHCINIAVQRIGRLNILDKQLKVNPNYSTSFFGLDFHEKREVAIEFSKEVATMVEDRIWSKWEKKRKKGDKLLLKLYTTNFDELKKWVKTFGRHARILKN